MLERIQIIRELRLGEYDVLVGVNLLREGLDLPEVRPTGRAASSARMSRSPWILGAGGSGVIG